MVPHRGICWRDAIELDVLAVPELDRHRSAGAVLHFRAVFLRFQSIRCHFARNVREQCQKAADPWRRAARLIARAIRRVFDPRTYCQTIAAIAG